MVAALVAVPVLVFAGTAARVWWVAREDSHPRSDAILVLGASQFDGRPSKVFQFRLAHAERLWRQGVAPVVVTVGGGQPGDRTTEAAAGAVYLKEHGVTNVVAVQEGRNTLQSLQAVKKVFVAHGWRSVIIVTDPWHSLRSRRMAQDLGMDAHTSPTRSGPAVHSRGTELRYVLRESAAYLYYRLFHRSDESGPHAV